MMTFIIGKRYASRSGHAVRVVEKIQGDDVYWQDDVGSGRCSRERFEEWVAPFPTDTAEVFQKSKRGKPVTDGVIGILKKELSAVRIFRAQIAEIKVELANQDLPPLIEASLMFLCMAANRLENELQDFPGYGKRLRKITRVDTDAESLQRLIASLRESLDFLSEADSKESVTRLLQVLSDGSDCLNRLRSFVAPFLVR